VAFVVIPASKSAVVVAIIDDSSNVPSQSVTVRFALHVRGVKSVIPSINSLAGGGWGRRALGRGGNAEEAEARRLSPFSCCDDDDDPTTATSAWVLVVTEESSRVATAITSCMVLGDLIVDYVIGGGCSI